MILGTKKYILPVRGNEEDDKVNLLHDNWMEVGLCMSVITLLLRGAIHNHTVRIYLKISVLQNQLQTETWLF